MKRAVVVMLGLLALAGCKTPKSKASRETLGTPERAVTALVRAIESGSAGSVQVQFPHENDLAAYFSCGVAMRASMDEFGQALTESVDGKAAKGTVSTFVSVELSDQKKLPPGPYEGDCKVLKALELASADSVWEMEGEKHHFKVSLIRLDGRWYIFDIPGM